MLRLLIHPARLVLDSLRDEKSPHLFALGIALGMIAGLVPKDNLTAAVLATLLLALRLNLGAAAASTLVFMWIGSLLDPIAHRLGHGVLGFPPLGAFFTYLFDLPFVPWTNLNNTVVLGNLILGLVFSVPVYVISRRSVARFAPALVERLERYKLFQAMRVAEKAAVWRTP